MTVTHQDLIEVSFPFLLRTFNPYTTELLFVMYTSLKQCWSKLRNGAEPDRAGSFDLLFLFIGRAARELGSVVCPV